MKDYSPALALSSRSQQWSSPLSFDLLVLFSASMMASAAIPSANANIHPVSYEDSTILPTHFISGHGDLAFGKPPAFASSPAQNQGSCPEFFASTSIVDKQLHAGCHRLWTISPEILSALFGLLKEHASAERRVARATTEIGTLVGLSSVCRPWRRVILGDGTLWTGTVPDSPLLRFAGYHSRLCRFMPSDSSPAAFLGDTSRGRPFQITHQHFCRLYSTTYTVCSLSEFPSLCILIALIHPADYGACDLSRPYPPLNPFYMKCAGVAFSNNPIL